MNANRRFNSIARRIHLSWQWKKFWQILFLNLLALAACLAAYLYAHETAVTGTFAGWDLPRAVLADGTQSGVLAWLRGLTYRFTWQGEANLVPMAPFVDLAVMFGGPVLGVEGVLWLLGFFGSSKGARRLLKPLDRMAATAQRLSDEANEIGVTQRSVVQIRPHSPHFVRHRSSGLAGPVSLKTAHSAVFRALNAPKGKACVAPPPLLQKQPFLLPAP